MSTILEVPVRIANLQSRHDIEVFTSCDFQELVNGSLTAWVVSAACVVDQNGPNFLNAQRVDDPLSNRIHKRSFDAIEYDYGNKHQDDRESG